MTTHGLGVTHACGLIGISRSLYQYESTRPSDEQLAGRLPVPKPSHLEEPGHHIFDHVDRLKFASPAWAIQESRFKRADYVGF
jgi:hypothetical protein